MLGPAPAQADSAPEDNPKNFDMVLYSGYIKMTYFEYIQMLMFTAIDLIPLFQGYQAGFIAGVQNSGFGAGKADAAATADDADTVDVPA